MAFKVIIKPVVWLDMDEAVDWYKKKSPGLGKRFYKNFDRAIDKILERPTAYFFIAQNVRRVLFENFPYKLLYSISGNNIYILGVFHAKRSKAGIRRRLKSK
jgi:plasmid stabilization system protein ParE